MRAAGGRSQAGERAGVAVVMGMTMAVAVLGVPTPAEGQAWDSGAWRFEAAEAEVAPHEGRDALLLRNGTAWLDGVDLRDGTVRVDLRAGADLGFYGIAFRADDGSDYEHVYVRPFVSGNPDAGQYTPVFRGASGWQIYGGPGWGGAVDVATDRWVRLELRFRDGRAELRVDGQRLVFPALQQATRAGAVGFTASGAPARFADPVVSSEAPAPIAVPTDLAEALDAAPAEGLITTWRLSTPVAEDRVAGTARLGDDLLDSVEWTTVAPDVRGVVDIARTRKLTADAPTVLAAVTLRSDAERSARLRFGFSDRVVVYLNGRPLYRGADGWRARDYKFLGTVGLFDELILPLESGDNELVLAVSESFGGWGVTAALLDAPGVAVVAR